MNLELMDEVRYFYVKNGDGVSKGTYIVGVRRDIWANSHSIYKLYGVEGEFTEKDFTELKSGDIWCSKRNWDFDSIGSEPIIDESQVIKPEPKETTHTPGYDVELPSLRARMISLLVIITFIGLCFYVGVE